MDVSETRHSRVLSSVFMFQGCYFVISGVWPVVHIASFIMATGPKQDIWLVQMVGLLSVSIGLTFLVAAIRTASLPILLGYSVAASFAAMDVIFVSNGTIPAVYLLDAAIQAVFLGIMTYALVRRRRQSKN